MPAVLLLLSLQKHIESYPLVPILGSWFAMYPVISVSWLSSDSPSTRSAALSLTWSVSLPELPHHLQVHGHISLLSLASLLPSHRQITR